MALGKMGGAAIAEELSGSGGLVLKASVYNEKCNPPGVRNAFVGRPVRSVLLAEFLAEFSQRNTL